MEKFKKRLFEILEVTRKDDPVARGFAFSIISLIILNVICVALETVISISMAHQVFFRAFEQFSVAVFTVEYILRIWVCTNNPKFSGPVRGRIRFMLSPLALVDLLAILPFYIPMVIPMDLRFLRVLRLARLLRLLKVHRYSESLKTIGGVLKSKFDELAVTLFVLFVLLVVASSLIYFAENSSQPAIFSSIPASMYWVLENLTNVGYEPVAPSTMAGKVLGIVIAFLGVGLFALPAGILASGFIEEIQKKRDCKKTCPHCGKPID
jgi:voltage-gated potassium channel